MELSDSNMRTVVLSSSSDQGNSNKVVELPDSNTERSTLPEVTSYPDQGNSNKPMELSNSNMKTDALIPSSDQGNINKVVELPNSNMERNTLTEATSLSNDGASHNPMNLSNSNMKTVSLTEARASSNDSNTDKVLEFPDANMKRAIPTEANFFADESTKENAIMETTSVSNPSKTSKVEWSNLGTKQATPAQIPSLTDNSNANQVVELPDANIKGATAATSISNANNPNKLVELSDALQREMNKGALLLSPNESSDSNALDFLDWDWGPSNSVDYPLPMPPPKPLGVNHEDSTTAQPESMVELDSSDDEDVRRSGRALKSRIITIDGHQVLRENNYDVVGGGYEFGKVDEDELLRIEAEKRRKRKLLSKQKEKYVPKPRVLSALELERRLKVEMVKVAIKERAERRNIFLSRHLKKIAPFLDIHVYQKLNDITPPGPETLPEVREQPKNIKAELRDYQLAGLDWMVKMDHRGTSMILGDEMGLGKTLQTISLLTYIKEVESTKNTSSLIVCPLSVISSWMTEFKRWNPSLKVFKLHSSDLKQRQILLQRLKANFEEYDAVVTTYDMIKNTVLGSFFNRAYFRYLVLDEGHAIKNRDTELAGKLRLCHFESCLLLTGTPLQNNLVELWALLNFMMPDIFTTKATFRRAFNLVDDQVCADTLGQARELLGLLMLRRMKTEVEKKLPLKLETKVICPLSNDQFFWYRTLLMKDISLLAKCQEKMRQGQTTKSKFQVLKNLVMQLRKCCNHPYLFPGAEANPNMTPLRDLIGASGKLAILDKLLCALYAGGHRVVLFSQFTSVLDILEDYLRGRGLLYFRLDGNTGTSLRTSLIDRFNAPGAPQFVFLMTTRAGGMGINLQTADTVILYDNDWNPQADIQAMARVHRLGQKKTVHVYRLVTGGTVEERISQHAERKLYLDRMVIGTAKDAAKSSGPQSGLSSADMFRALTFGADTIFGKASQGTELPSDQDIATLIDRNRSGEESIGMLTGSAAQSTGDYNPGNDQLSGTQALCGVDFSSLRGKLNNMRFDTLSLQNMKIGKRAKKSRIVHVKSEGCGYGGATVPVLKTNNYDLLEGEKSVFHQELAGRSAWSSSSLPSFGKKRVRFFENQAHCQYCHNGGNLIMCDHCPVSMCDKCVPAPKSNTYKCEQHRCVACQRTPTMVGGLLFRCEACPKAFCSTCLPPKDEINILGGNPRYVALRYPDRSMFCYIHCSGKCEEIARRYFGWKPPNVAEDGAKRTPLEPIDVSDSFKRTETSTSLQATVEELSQTIEDTQKTKEKAPKDLLVSHLQTRRMKQFVWTTRANTNLRYLVIKHGKNFAKIAKALSPSLHPFDVEQQVKKLDILLPLHAFDKKTTRKISFASSSSFAMEQLGRLNPEPQAPKVVLKLRKTPVQSSDSKELANPAAKPEKLKIVVKLKKPVVRPKVDDKEKTGPGEIPVENPLVENKKAPVLVVVKKPALGSEGMKENEEEDDDERVTEDEEEDREDEEGMEGETRKKPSVRIVLKKPEAGVKLQVRWKRPQAEAVSPDSSAVAKKPKITAR